MNKPIAEGLAAGNRPSHRDEGDLSRLADKIVFTESVLSREPASLIPAEKSRIFHAVFGPYPPQEIFDRLAQGCDRMRLFLPAEAPLVNSPVTVRMEHRNGASTMETSFSGTAPFSRAEDLFVPSMEITEGPRGAGTATKINRNLVRLALDCYPQMQRIERLYSKTGAYSGARLFSIPTRGAWAHLREALRNKRNIIAPRLSEEDRVTLDSILANDNPKAIWQLAEMTTPLEFTIPRETTTVGKFMLKGNTWRGYFDLKDSEAVAKLMTYAETPRPRTPALADEKGMAQARS